MSRIESLVISRLTALSGCRSVRLALAAELPERALSAVFPLGQGNQMDFRLRRSEYLAAIKKLAESIESAKKP